MSSMGMQSVPLSSFHVRWPTMLNESLTHDSGCFAKSAAVSICMSLSFSSHRRPMPQTSPIGNKESALRLFSSLSIKQQ